MLVRPAVAMVAAVATSLSVLTVLAQPAPAEERLELSDCTIVGTFGPDVLVGTGGDDVICGRGGDDRIRGGGGHDVLLGGTGDDVLYGGVGDDLIQGGRGDDRIFGDAGRDVLRGGRGADRLQAGDGRSSRDRLNCGPGRDRVVADAPDRIRGGCEVVRQDDAPTSIALRPAVIAEGQPAGTVVGRLTAADRDRGDRHSFALVAGAGSTDNAAFRVQGTSLVSSRTFDQENEPALRVRVRATDTTGLRLERILTVTVSDTDGPPTAVDDEQTVLEDAAAAPIDVLANDTDADGGPRAIVSVTQPDHGTVQIAADGARVTYRPESDHCTDDAGEDSNADTFTYRLAPGGSTATVRVTVRCEPDAPTLATSDGVVSYTENAPAEAVDPGLTVGDADGRLAAAAVEIVSGLRAGDDVLELLGTHGGIEATWDDGELRLVGDASVADYRAALRDVAYRNTSEAPTTVTRQLRVTVTDDDGLVAAAERSMAVVSVNDAPSNQVPEVQRVDEDAPATAVDGVSIADADAGSGVVETVLTTTDGTLTVATGAGNGSAEVTVRGTVDQVNDSLADLQYQPDADGSGDRSITITTSDLGNTGTGGALTDTDTVGIDVIAINDAPVITVPGSTTLDENGSRPFSAAGGNAIAVTDVDAGAGTVRAVLDATSGRLTLGRTTGLSFSVGDGSADAELDLTGTVDDITAALDGVSYQPDGGFNGADRIAISVDDLGNTGAGGAKTADEVVPIIVTAVNDAPVNTVPGTQTTAEDTLLTLSGSNALTVADVDAVTLQVTLSAVDGTLTLAGTTGLTFTDGTGTNDPAMTLTGTKAAINTALDGLQFRPAADYHGSAELRIVTSDLGATGSGGTKADTDVVAITVAPVNDAPSFTPGPNQSGVANQDTDGQAAPYTIDPWATAISAGPGEDDQTLTFDVSADDEALFTTVPSISPAGVLRFTPNPEATGTATVTVRLVDDGGTDDGGTDTSAARTFTIEIVEPGPSIASISPSPLVPGASATLTGREFSPTASDNTVTIGGTAATVTAATATSLTVTVPCVSSGAAVAVAAKVGAVATNTVHHPLQALERDLEVGESLVLDEATQIGCNELAATGGNARYLVAAYSASTSPSSNSPFTLSGVVAADPASPDAANAPVVPTPPAGTGSPVSPDLDSGVRDNAHEDDHGLEPLDAPDHDDQHTELLENNRVQYEVLRDEFGTDGIQRRGVQPDTAAADLPTSRPFRISNINAPGGAICNSYYTANATRVYAEGKLVIYEDDTTPDGLKAANNPAMADYYDRIGDQFNSDMEPIIRDNFGDVLRRDAVTDDNGVMIALSTPRINNSFSGLAGFVVTCDQFPNDDTSTPPVGGPYTGTGTNGASNFGEFFYLYQPTNTATGSAAGTASTWYRTVRSTFIHESKHVASLAARVANDAPSVEDAWLEEGTARLAEELWARQAVDNLPWKANTGYGSATDPVGLYCDLRPGFAECDSNPRRPASIMQRHFTTLYTHLYGTNARLLSPFGATASDNAYYYYAVSWSLVRYAIDRYGTSDAAFLTALTQSTSTGVANLSERTGVSTDQLLGRWATALALDDHPLLTSSTDDTAFATWNFRSIYAGLNQDLPSTYTMAYPLAPTQLGFGTFTANPITTLRGGGVLWYELSGSHTRAQLLRMQGNGGAAIPATIRLAITRVQ